MVLYNGKSLPQYLTFINRTAQLYILMEYATQSGCLSENRVLELLFSFSCVKNNNLLEVVECQLCPI